MKEYSPISFEFVQEAVINNATQKEYNPTSLDLFQGIITNAGLWGAIIATIAITLLGFLLYKFKVLNDTSTGAIQKVIINVIVPFLSFYSFMRNAASGDLKTIGIILLISVGYYVILTSFAMFWVKVLPHALPKSVINRAQKNFEEWQANVELSNRLAFKRENYLESLQKKHLVTWLMCIYGSNILFATPIVLAVYPNGLELTGLSIWNTLYYIGGFGLAYTLISGVKFTKAEFKYTIKKVLLNPAFVVVVISIILWTTQYIPGAGAKITNLDASKENPITVFYGRDVQTGKALIDEIHPNLKATFGPNFETLYGYRHQITGENGNQLGVVTNWFAFDKINHRYYIYNGKPTGWFNWKVTMPYIAKFITILAGLISPLIWIVIGTSLAKTNIKQMFSNGRNWFFLFLKMVIMPLLILCLMIPAVKFWGVPVNVAAVLVMTGSVPPGTTVVIYSQHFKVHGEYTAQVSSLSTICSFIFIPTWLVIGTVALNALAK